MTRKEAAHLAEVLLARNADCQCGNKWLEDEEIEAIRLLISEAENEEEE